VNITFQVSGTDADEIEERAREVCRRFFGDRRYMLTMEVVPSDGPSESVEVSVVEAVRWMATVGATAVNLPAA
jgi:hypothetical protein